MKIGIPREVKSDEYRIGMIPAGVNALVREGHKVAVQKGGGVGSGIPDEEYITAGAEILENPAIDWEGSDVERELSALPEAFRQAVILVDLGELTYEEAAEVAGCPVGTIRSRLARARRQLAARLRDLARSRGLVRE